MSVWVVVGGQYGSEGKGKISAFIALAGCRCHAASRRNEADV